MNAEARSALARASLAKGDAIAAARIAGIMAAKRTSDIVPLCHPLPLTGIAVELDITGSGVRAVGTVRTFGRTGVEMEALTAVTAALLTIYDMAKAVDRAMVIGEVRLLSKQGGGSGGWTAGDDAGA